MGESIWKYVGAGGLLLLLWFILSPQTFLRNSARGPWGQESREAGLEFPAPAPQSSSQPSPKKQPASPAFDAGLETGAGKKVPGEKLVRFSSREAYRKFLAGAPPGAVLGQLDALLVARVRSGEWLGAAVRESGGSVSSNYYVRVPEVPLEVREKGEEMYRAVGKKALDLIGAEGVTDAWGRGVKVALMDTPLEGVEQVSGETAGHGTAMRSLITGAADSVRGAAPGAEVVPFAVLDQEGKGSSFVLAEAILKAADQGARVINMSLGSEGDSPVVRDAVAYALGKNVVLVAAAGNEAVNRVSYPAAYEGVVAVASVDGGALPGNLPAHLYFSNRGKQVDVAAPGLAVLAAWPGGKKVVVSGTSASTALVSGAISALLSQEPGLSGRQAVELITRYADGSGLPGSAEETGGGILNLGRVLNRNQRGVVDVALGGVKLVSEGQQGRILVGIQNRGNETVNSPSLEITVGAERRKFYFGSLAPGQTASESMSFDWARARQAGNIQAGAVVTVRGDQQENNNSWMGYFRIPTEP